MTSPENRAHHLVETYLRELNGSEPAHHERLHALIADAIHKAVIEDREALREKMPCSTGEPCGFELCAHHKALVAAVMSVQHGTPPPPRSLFSRPLG
ncbi:MAG TPA: hypothetical protein VIE36_24280 [Methylomirabilota bacterium]|jgi:hypothetical protein